MCVDFRFARRFFFGIFAGARNWVNGRSGSYSGFGHMNHDGDVREFLHLAGSIGLLALHGGLIEPGTEEIARTVAEQSGASLYVYSGRRPADNLALHRPSHGIELDSRPLVLQFLNHVNTAISIHGHGRDCCFAYVGGLNQDMVQTFVELARSILPQYKWICDPETIPAGIKGRNPNNIVNLPPLQGMQLEMPKTLRQTKPSQDGRRCEPVGDALVLSDVLVRFVGMVMGED